MYVSTTHLEKFYESHCTYLIFGNEISESGPFCILVMCERRRKGMKSLVLPSRRVPFLTLCLLVLHEPTWVYFSDTPKIYRMSSSLSSNFIRL